MICIGHALHAAARGRPRSAARVGFVLAAVLAALILIEVIRETA